MATFYGSDTFGISDIGLVDTLVTDPRVLIGQRLARRLSTPRGALGLINDDPDGGYDVRQLVNAKLGANFQSIASSQIRSECLKDEQVESVDVSLTSAGGNVTITINAVSSAGPFSLTLNVSQLTVEAVFSFQGTT